MTSIKVYSLPELSFLLYSTNPLQVNEDVANISPLTKSAIQSFFASYISPRSPTRRTLSVHLLAQSTPDAPDPAEQRSKLQQAITQFLGQHKVSLTNDNAGELERRLSKVDLTTAPAELPTRLAVLLGEFLIADVMMTSGESLPIVEAGKEALPAVLASLGIDIADGATPDDATEAPLPVRPLVKIEDVSRWKASLQVSSGARPVKELGAFEELGAKL
jgi:insulysin